MADYLGRRRMMMLAILAYSITTSLSAFAYDWLSFALLRLLVGIAARFDADGDAVEHVRY